jgi:hypothetical protein
MQGIGNTTQQGNINVVLSENLMHMGAGTANVFGQLCGRRTLLPHYLFYMLPNVHKKAWNLFNLLAIGFPRPHNNKLFHAKRIGAS